MRRGETDFTCLVDISINNKLFAETIIIYTFLKLKRFKKILNVY